MSYDRKEALSADHSHALVLAEISKLCGEIRKNEYLAPTGYASIFLMGIVIVSIEKVFRDCTAETYPNLSEKVHLIIIPLIFMGLTLCFFKLNHDYLCQSQALDDCYKRLTDKLHILTNSNNKTKKIVTYFLTQIVLGNPNPDAFKPPFNNLMQGLIEILDKKRVKALCKGVLSETKHNEVDKKRSTVNNPLQNISQNTNNSAADNSSDNIADEMQGYKQTQPAKDNQATDSPQSEKSNSEEAVDESGQKNSEPCSSYENLPSEKKSFTDHLADFKKNSGKIGSLFYHPAKTEKKLSNRIKPPADKHILAQPAASTLKKNRAVLTSVKTTLPDTKKNLQLGPETRSQELSPEEASQNFIKEITAWRKKLLLSAEIFLTTDEIEKAAKYKLTNQQSSLLATTFSLMKTLKKLAFFPCVTLIVGGWLQDRLSGVQHAGDMDLAVNATAEQLATILHQHFKDTTYQVRMVNNIELLQLEYQGHKFDFQCDPNIKIQTDGLINIQSLVTNCLQRDLTNNCIFLNDNGHFSMYSSEIQNLIIKSLKKQGYLKKKAGEKDSSFIKVVESDTGIKHWEIETLIPNWKKLIQPPSRYNQPNPILSIKELENTVRHFVTNPKMIFRCLASLIVEKTQTIDLDPSIILALSNPILIAEIFAGSLIFDKKNLLNMILGFMKTIGAAFAHQLNNAPIQPDIFVTEPASSAITSKESNVNNESPADLKLKVGFGGNFNVEVLMKLCRQQLRKLWETPIFQRIFLLTLSAEASPRAAAKMEQACHLIFTGSIMQHNLEKKVKSTVSISADKNPLLDWLINRLIKFNLIDSLSAFRDKLSLNIMPVFPHLADKIFPFALVVWWHQNQKCYTLPPKAEFYQQIMGIINEFPFLKQAFSGSKCIDAIIDENYVEIAEHLSVIVPTSEVTLVSTTAPSLALTIKENTEFKQSSSSASLWVKKTPIPALTVEESSVHSQALGT